MDLLSLLDQLEEALPDMRDALGGEGAPEGEEEELPPLPDEEMPEEEAAPEGEAEMPMDLMTPPSPKKKPKLF